VTGDDCSACKVVSDHPYPPGNSACAIHLAEKEQMIFPGAPQLDLVVAELGKNIRRTMRLGSLAGQLSGNEENHEAAARHN